MIIFKWKTIVVKTKDKPKHFAFNNILLMVYKIN